MAAIQDAPTSVPSAFDTKPTEQGVTVMGTGDKEINIRNMVVEDADFVGEMMFEAFPDKMENIAGTNGVPRFLAANQDYYKVLADRYHRFFVAELDGEKAGVIQLTLREDEFKEPENFNWFSYVSCCAGMRLISTACIEATCLKPKLQDCYITFIAVATKFRGCGVGKALLDRADQEGRAAACKRMSLHCTTTNRAKNLYLRQGYVIEKKTDGCCFTWNAYGVRYFFRMEKEL